jgi:hypothetical protein
MSLMWVPIDNGETVDTIGFEGGTILKDEQYGDHARITLEEDGTAPYIIIATLAGFTDHICFYDDLNTAETYFERIKVDLERLIGLIPADNDPDLDDRRDILTTALEDFVQRY